MDASSDNLSRSGEHSLGDLLTDISRSFDHEQADASRKATRIWLEVNGDIERKHTMATFLSEDGGKKTLVVYIDSSALIQNFSTNRLLYLGRLANGGLEVDDIRFKLSRYRHDQKNDGLADQEENKETPFDELPEISNKMKEEIKAETSQLPPKLRAAVSEAFVSSVRRSQDPNTDFD
jgi:hypothetical protein